MVNMERTGLVKSTWFICLEASAHINYKVLDFYISAVIKGGKN